MVYNSEIEKMWGEEVFPKKIVVAATAREIRESRGKKKTHFKLDSNVGHVAWKDFVVTKLDDESYSPKTYAHKIVLKGFLVGKLKDIKPPISQFGI